MEHFAEWLKRRGAYVSPKLDLFGAGSGEDRTVRARESIEEGERLLLVPENATLFATAAGSDAASSNSDLAAAGYLAASHPGLSSFMRTVLTLMAELARGKDSPWSAYLDCLPEHTDCLMAWSGEERKLLEGTSIEDKGRSPEDIFSSDISPIISPRQDLWPPAASSYAAFRRAAELVQTRAFHLKAENWVTGAVQEAVEQLYLIPAMDMLNHSTLPELRNTTLERIKSPMTVQVEGVGEMSFEAFFTMKAERPIAAGEEVLHTYGDLSDAQLLQTYGFVEQLPGGFSANSHNYALVPYAALVDGAARTLGTSEAEALVKGKLLEAKEKLLGSCGLLQAAAPHETEFVATAGEPLGDELLTTVQVLLMTPAEFDQLRAEQEAAGDEGGSGNGGGGDPGGATAGTSGRAEGHRLSLGRDLLQGDFGEMVGSTILQACGLALKRYPASSSSSESAAPASRAWAAARVVEGEKSVLTQLKRAALMVMAEAAGDNGDDDEDEDEEDEDGDDDEEEQLDGSDEDKEEGEEEAKHPQTHRTKKRGVEAAGTAAAPAAEGAVAEAAAQDAKRGKRHRTGGLGYKQGEEKQQQQHHKEGKSGEKRALYGNLTGPDERDVLESDDSDKVGYEEEAEQGGERHPPPADHRYETAADGHTREVHGDMVGPDEEEVIMSDDSDKVGYA